MTEKARVLYQRGLELSEAGDLVAAKAQLSLALAYEKTSPAIQAAVAHLNEVLEVLRDDSDEDSTR